MNSISVNYTLIWQVSFAENYQFTKDGKCFNTLTGRQIRQVYNSGSIGYNIKGKFYSLSFLRKNLQKCKKQETPF